MAELRQIATAPCLVFDALAEGAADAPLVLLLHGFSESLHMWRAQVPALAAAGYRAVAPSQRGYSPLARPDPANAENYQFDRLVADAIDVVVACGHADRRFHLVGHDWGGSIAWGLADRYPNRLASLTVLSRPHPNAFNRALAMPDGDQAHRSRHHKAFLEPDAGARLLADGARPLRERLATSGVPASAIEEHLAVLGNAPAMEAALAWYRARGAIRSPLGMIKVPTLMCGAMPTTPSDSRPPRARTSSSPAPIGSRLCRGSATSSPTRLPSGSMRCCWRTSPRIRPSRMASQGVYS